MSGKVDILLGLQWGDEGKGKIVDVLAPKYDIVARFQGGPNAGHTLEFDGRKHVLHQIPSGIFQKNTLNVIGNGVVLDPITFIKELDSIKQYDLDIKSQLLISNKAQLIIPTHRWLDRAYEKSKGESKIGSTLRGIGPTYQDKMARVGLRIGDTLEADFSERYNKLRDRHLDILAHYDAEFDLDKEEKEFFEALDILREFSIINTEYFINNSLKENKSILAEGAQGSLLDIDFGSYPFVTSSNTISAGACTGLGVSPRMIGEVYGIFKAYCTRVGSGPFPTELHGDAGESLRAKGREFGATTGRPRRCGWLDLPGLNYAVMLNGVTQLFMMKVDVLAEMESLKVATHYKHKGQETFEVPPIFNEDWSVEYKDFKSWGNSNFASYAEFPEELSDYIAFVEQNTSVPVNLVSVGPDRSQTILK
jgi:adenylosuccinate synthase